MNTEIAQLKKQNRLLKIGISIGALFFLFVAADTTKTRFKEIDVERINIISEDGKRELVLSNRKLIPRGFFNGEEIGGDRRSAGMVFYNDIGDECGGLIHSGQLDANGNPIAAIHFSMDRFGGDQEMVLAHYERGGIRETGLRVQDNNLLFKDILPLVKEYEKAERAQNVEEMSAIRKKLEQINDVPLAQRVFVGRGRQHESTVLLGDAKGRPRILMQVSAEGDPSLQFLGDDGKPVYSLPPKAEQKADSKPRQKKP